MKIVKLIVVLVATIVWNGCTQNSTNSDNNEHEESLQLTAYNENIEVFAEAEPFVVGNESKILAHFTYLDNFKPIEEGSIKASLTIGEKTVCQTLEKPTRIGIYSFTLTPDVEGAGELQFTISTSKGNAVIVILNIKVFGNMDDAQHYAADVEIESSNGVLFTKEQSWEVDFATEPCRKGAFGQVIKSVGQIIHTSSDNKIVSAKMSGMVSFPTNEFIDGKAVNAGETLFYIESEGLADNNMEVRYKEAAGEYYRTKANYERKQVLAKDKIVSESDLLNAKTEFEAAEAIYKNLQKNYSKGRQAVKAPINGFIEQILVRNGEYVEAGQPLVSVSQNNKLFVKAEIQPKYYALLKEIQSANFRVMNSETVYSLEDLEGEVASYGKSAGLNNPLIPVIFQIKNKADFLPGSFLEVYIKTQDCQQAVTVPNTSIVEEMGNYFVYVQLTPELFEKREVKKGVTDGYRTQITEGLSGTERVVSKGAVWIKLAQSSGALDVHSGHVH